ncbi:C40 family peptidase [Acidimangrovimonas sediminis]|uniref:C40 family peptidase n=1 Tax=Acidimangrovimonas sediminis TaxID=2056283 RepID=UPI000C80B659|nr:NlpC/P60 family protein [Acidimangrovimonas sediminis]
MTWAARHIGLPYADLGRDACGYDCWGLVRRVYGMDLGILLPSYAGAYTSAEESAEVEALIDAGRAAGPWSPVADPRPYDVLLFRRGRFRAHVGLFVDARHMLHMAEVQSVIEDRAAPAWAHRLIGIYRHVEAPVEGSVQ